GIGAVEFASLDERSDAGPVLRSLIMAGEERVLAIEHNRTDAAFDDVSIELDATVVEEKSQPLPMVQGIADGLGDQRFARDACELMFQPRFGREGRVRNISGQDNAILQQIMAASRPLAVTDIARFANRDDIANIQYSLKKLVRAGLIAKAGRRSARETSYVVTPLARKWTASFLALRRQLFTDPSAQILGFDDQLEKSTNLLNLIAGFYDHGTRVMTGAEQMETRRPT